MTKGTATEVDAYIGEKIRGYRNLKGISQQQLGEALGVSFQQIQKYEKGVNRVSASRVDQLAAIFEIKIADLMPKRGKGTSTKLTNADRVVATLDGIKLVDSFVNIKDEKLRAAVVDLARRFQGQ
jgi:transcriptional regulator with XRE-family HTH domain